MSEAELLCATYASFVYSSFFKKKNRQKKASFSLLHSGNLPHLSLLQGLFYSGELGDAFVSTQKDKIKILDFGQWNKKAGADFLHARFLLRGQLFEGSLLLTYKQEDQPSALDLTAPFLHFYSLPKTAEERTPEAKLSENDAPSALAEVLLPQDLLYPLLGKSKQADNYTGSKAKTPLSSWSEERVSSLLYAAAAYRWEQKRDAIHRIADSLGWDQAFYESLAETLGYGRNKHLLRHLAQRLPFSQVQTDTEAILFGCAGFLPPYLKEKTTPSAEALHQRLWETWWKRREEFEISPERLPAWEMSTTRPVNRPERRLAALCLIVQKWKEFKPLFLEPSLHATALIEAFANLSHPYWSRHITLPGHPLQSILALLGKEKALTLLINHLLPAENTPQAWQLFTRLKAPSLPTALKEKAGTLWGKKSPLNLSLYWQQQGVLQLYYDFCLTPEKKAAYFPASLELWGIESEDMDFF